MALAKSQKSLKSWTKQKWRTKSGKKSSKTGERYLPAKAIKALTDEEINNNIMNTIKINGHKKQ